MMLIILLSCCVNRLINERVIISKQAVLFTANNGLEQQEQNWAQTQKTVQWGTPDNIIMITY